jgi:hypothetical protein
MMTGKGVLLSRSMRCNHMNERKFHTYFVIMTGTVQSHASDVWISSL